MICLHCQQRGIIRVNYHSGEPFDLAICDCPMGQVYRRTGVDFVRAQFGLGAEHDIAWREDFDEQWAPAPAPADFIAAGKTVKKRAKL